MYVQRFDFKIFIEPIVFISYLWNRFLRVKLSLEIVFM